MGKTSASEVEQRLDEKIREARGMMGDLERMIRQARPMVEKMVDEVLVPILKEQGAEIRASADAAILQNKEVIVQHFEDVLDKIEVKAQEISGGRSLMDTADLLYRRSQEVSLSTCDICTKPRISNMDIWTHWTASRCEEIPLEVQQERIRIAWKCQEVSAADLLKVYSARMYYAVGEEFRKDPRWFLCEECHLLVTGPESNPITLVKRWRKNHGNHVISSDPALINEFKDRVEAGLAFFWFWRTDRVEEPGTYRLPPT